MEIISPPISSPSNNNQIEDNNNNNVKDINNNNDNDNDNDNQLKPKSQFTIEAEVHSVRSSKDEDRISMIGDNQFKLIELETVQSDQIRPFCPGETALKFVSKISSADLNSLNDHDHDDDEDQSEQDYYYESNLDYVLDTTSTESSNFSQTISSNDNNVLAHSESSKTDNNSSFEMISEALDTLDDVLIKAEDRRLNNNNDKLYGSLNLSKKSSLLTDSSVISLNSFTDTDSNVQNGGFVYRSTNNIDQKPEHTATSQSNTTEEEEPKKREFIRKVERFGTDLSDPCLFPLALTMDGSDVYRGQSNWETLNLKADCILTIWSDKSNDASSSNNKVVGHNFQNSVLSNPIKFLCLRPELSDRFLLYPDARLPFRKCYSEVNLSQLGIDEQNGCMARSDKELPLIRTKTKKYDFMQNTLSSASHIPSDILPQNDDQPLVRNRSRTSLTLFQSKLFSSDKATEQRKDRFNLNLTLNMKTKAKLLASKRELDDSSRFARHLSRLEKKYYLDITERELMSLVFKKGFIDCVKLKEMIKFGQEVSQLIANLICAEFTVDDQGQLIANIIETLFILYHNQNFQSFESVMRGLCLPEVYRLANAWKVVQQKYPRHLSVYHYLTSILSYRMHNSVMYPSTPSLPTLSSFVRTMEIRCISIWDQMEGKRHWQQAPNLVGWLNQYKFDESDIEKKIKQKLIIEIDSKLNRWRKRTRQKLPLRNYLRMRRKNTLAKKLTKREKPSQINYETLDKLKSLFPFGCVESNQLPITWTLRSTRHLPNEFKIQVMREFNTVYQQMMLQINSYKY